jgi:hypothetical protein
MTRYRAIPLLILAAAIPVAAAPARDTVTAAQVAAAMSGSGIKIAPEQVEFLSDVVATTSAPGLKVEGTEVWGDRRIKVRMSCVRPEECLPFFVAIRGSQTQEVPPVIADGASSPILRAKSDSNSFVLRSGSHATLLLEGGNVHIQMLVICLENGAIGQTIRVSSLDHKQTYTAQVSGSTVLKGRL